MPKPQPPDYRRRSVATRLTVRRRAAAEGVAEQTSIVGHASVFDAPTTLYDGRYYKLTEVIRKGCFASAIAEEQDVRCLFNHDADFVLGRTRSGTLRLSEDAAGLMTECDPPGTQTIRDLVIAPIDRGDVDGMSFKFLPRISPTTTITENEDGSVTIDRGGVRTTRRYDGETCIEQDEVLDVDLYDVSPVTFPQYDGTDCEVASRSRDLSRRIAEGDRPHRRSSPKRDAARRWLDEGAASAS